MNTSVSGGYNNKNNTSTIDPSNYYNHHQNYLSPILISSPINNCSVNDINNDECSNSDSHSHNNKVLNSNVIVIDNVPMCNLKSQTQAAPVFIDHEKRQFLNPISYIGGPTLGLPTAIGADFPIIIRDSSEMKNRNTNNRKSIDSITSVLSID